MSELYEAMKKVQEQDIISRLRRELPRGASITEDDHAVIFRCPGLKPIIFSATGVTITQLVDTTHQIVEFMKT